MKKYYRQITRKKEKDDRKIFVLSGNLVFEAHNLDDAFNELSKHFKGLIDGEGIDTLPDTDITLNVRK